MQISLIFIHIYSTLRKGKHKLNIWPDVEADGNHDTTTPSKVKGQNDNDMNKLEKVYSNLS